MSETTGTGEMHAALKTALQELLPDMLRDHAHGPSPVPQVPAPPVAQTLRPSTWNPTDQAPDPASRSAAPAPAAAAAAGDARVEPVRIGSDRDLDAFVRALAHRLESPAERAAVMAGRLRFTLGHAAAGAAPAASAAAGDAHRVERGAVTERIVERAAKAGGVIVLGPKAVLTPMGKDRARALGVRIEREASC
ncbi:MAG: hypothetical protein ACKO7U_11665 [Actinomycetota bacterium]